MLYQWTFCGIPFASDDALRQAEMLTRETRDPGDFKFPISDPRTTRT